MSFSRQNSFEHLVEKYQELVKKIDEFNHLKEDLSNFIKAQLDKNESIISIQKNLGSGIQNVEMRLSDSIRLANQNAEKHSRPIVDLQNHQEKLGNHVKHHENRLSQLFDEFVQLKSNQEKFAKNDRLEILKSDHEFILYEHKKSIDAHKIYLSSLMESYESCIKKLDSQDKNISAVSHTLSDQTQQISELSFGLSYLNQKISNDFLILENSLKEYVNNKIDSIPVPEIPSLGDIKNQTDKQLEPVILDAKNSNSRSVNNEMKISILEKKVEQLQLLLKQYELQK